MMHRRTTKLLSYSLIRLNANMQSTRARDRNTRLSRIVIDRMRRSSPSIYVAIADLSVLACVIVVSSCEPYLRIEMPSTRNEIPVNVLTHLSNCRLSASLMLSISGKGKSVSLDDTLSIRYDFLG